MAEVLLDYYEKDGDLWNDVEVKNVRIYDITKLPKDKLRALFSSVPSLDKYEARKEVLDDKNLVGKLRVGLNGGREDRPFAEGTFLNKKVDVDLPSAGSSEWHVDKVRQIFLDVFSDHIDQALEEFRQRVVEELDAPLVALAIQNADSDLVCNVEDINGRRFIACKNKKTGKIRKFYLTDP